MENEKLIAALRYCDAVVNDTVNTGSCNFCPYRNHCSDLDNEAADALERLQAELDAAVEDLKIASDCATCDMRGGKGFSACAPLFVGDEQSCKNYKWRGKENGDGKENS